MDRYRHRSFSLNTEATQRIAMVVEFDGRFYHGWQKQDNATSAQATLETALQNLEGHPIKTICAGRTDSGVHAEAMLVHADVSQARWQRSARAYTQGINHQIKEGLAVTGVLPVEEDFHARFSCLERSYRYQIWNRTTPSVLAPWRHWWMPRPINLEAMQEAAQYLLGTHDFTSFRASHCQAHTAIRTIHHIDMVRQGWEIHINISANAFLYHMVRNIMGNLIQVGIGRWSPQQLADILAAQNRNQAAATAPARGLYFTNARYPNFSSKDWVGKEWKGKNI